MNERVCLCYVYINLCSCIRSNARFVVNVNQSDSISSANRVAGWDFSIYNILCLFLYLVPLYR